MICPRCQRRKARRACPALRQDICAVCCGSQRLVEIACPPDCGYLEAAQRNPAAVVRRQQERDVALMMTALGRVSEGQLQLFFLIQAFIGRFQPEGLPRLIDADVAEAAAALARTYETRASSGVVYEQHAEQSRVAEALRGGLATLLEEIGKGGGARFERECAAVLRGIERGARHEPAAIGTDETAYLALVGRVLQLPKAGSPPPSDGQPTIVLP
ncbi:MAG: hypothetical protein AB7O67_06260 [Vicinamibacterales bacterium]